MSCTIPSLPIHFSPQSLRSGTFSAAETDPIWVYVCVCVWRVCVWRIISVVCVIFVSRQIQRKALPQSTVAADPDPTTTRVLRIYSPNASLRLHDGRLHQLTEHYPAGPSSCDCVRVPVGGKFQRTRLRESTGHHRKSLRRRLITPRFD